MVTSVYSKKLNIDCANGVGGTKFKEIMVLAKGLFEINLCNIDGPLNYKVNFSWLRQKKNIKTFFFVYFYSH